MNVVEQLEQQPLFYILYNSQLARSASWRLERSLGTVSFTSVDCDVSEGPKLSGLDMMTLQRMTPALIILDSPTRAMQ